ncbi:MAG: hypothetical protein AAFR68_17175 [Pseudomonadota bacterium]
MRNNLGADLRADEAKACFVRVAGVRRLRWREDADGTGRVTAWSLGAVAGALGTV